MASEIPPFTPAASAALSRSPKPMAINYEDYDNDETPTKGKMTASRERAVNHNMATLKRVEGRINRYRKEK